MLNRVVLMGRLVADPELKTTNTGVSVTTFRIAVDRSYVKAGAERETDFFDIVAWRGTAEFVCRNFAKGSLIAVDGQLQSRQYTTKDGQNRTVIEVVTDNVSFTGERRDSVGIAENRAVSNETAQGGNLSNYQQTHNTARNPGNPRVYPQSGQVPQQPQYTQDYQQPQYQQGYQQPQYAPSAAYDPRDPQGRLPDQPLQTNGDLPF